MLTSRVNLRVICRLRVHASENNSDPALIVATADRVNAVRGAIHLQVFQPEQPTGTTVRLGPT